QQSPTGRYGPPGTPEQVAVVLSGEQMENVGDQHYVMASGQCIGEEVARHHVDVVCGRVAPELLARQGRSSGQLEKRRLQIGVALKDCAEPGAGPAADVEQTAMAAEIVRGWQGPRRRHLDRLDSFGEDALFLLKEVERTLPLA